MLEEETNENGKGRLTTDNTHKLHRLPDVDTNPGFYL